jgi:bifunctional ADP-heptose synthase (sugar kinase/adenylyltransferase)
VINVHWQENDRAVLVAGLACVDRVVLFSEKRLTRVIENLCPDLYAKGGDYTLETMDQGERAALEACGAEICFFQLIEGQSTTGMIERLLQHGRA